LERRLSGGIKEHAQKAIAPLIGLLVFGAFSFLSYIFLNSVAKPYWIVGKDFTCGTNSLHTYYVVNPGPWATRTPVVEFMPQAGAEIVDFSPGVTVATLENKFCVRPDGGLPPGCAYFLTYKHSCTDADPMPAVTCDGKPCKTSPSFDLDLILKLLICGNSILLLGCIIFAALFFESRRALIAEKGSSLRDAVEALLASRQAEFTVENSIKSLANAAQDMKKLLGAVKPKDVKKSQPKTNNTKRNSQNGK
jgi:hypothetical protein